MRSSSISDMYSASSASDGIARSMDYSMCPFTDRSGDGIIMFPVLLEAQPTPSGAGSTI